MDRTSILGDTIDYMKELMEKIQDLKEQDMDSDVDHMKMLASVKEFNMNESHVRNPPKVLFFYYHLNYTINTFTQNHI